MRVWAKKRCAADISRKDSQLLSETELEQHQAVGRRLHVCSVFHTSLSETSKHLEEINDGQQLGIGPNVRVHRVAVWGGWRTGSEVQKAPSHWQSLRLLVSHKMKICQDKAYTVVLFSEHLYFSQCFSTHKPYDNSYGKYEWEWGPARFQPCPHACSIFFLDYIASKKNVLPLIICAVCL